jgi:DHA1 family inner membrane transport protein
LLSAVAPSFAVLAVAQGVTGVGLGLLVAIAIAAAGEWSSGDERPRTLAWAIAGMPVAWIVGMPAAGAAASLGWRMSWLVPAVAALAVLGLLRLRPADPRTNRTGDAATAAWRRPEVARFAAAELLANAAWASLLTYSGALLIESYGASRETVALGLSAVAAAMVPGTFLGRRRAPTATIGMLVGLTIVQACLVTAVGVVRPDADVTLSLLMAMAFINGWRSVIASTVGMDSAPDDKVAVMSMRASANQFGYLLGAATGALALAVGGFEILGFALAGLFGLGALLHTRLSYAASARRPAMRPALAEDVQPGHIRHAAHVRDVAIRSAPRHLQPGVVAAEPRRPDDRPDRLGAEIQTRRPGRDLDRHERLGRRDRMPVRALLDVPVDAVEQTP